jgi:hypothetical protein
MNESYEVKSNVDFGAVVEYRSPGNEVLFTYLN